MPVLETLSVRVYLHLGHVAVRRLEVGSDRMSIKRDFSTACWSCGIAQRHKSTPGKRSQGGKIQIFWIDFRLTHTILQHIAIADRFIMAFCVPGMAPPTLYPLIPQQIEVIKNNAPLDFYHTVLRLTTSNIRKNKQTAELIHLYQVYEELSQALKVLWVYDEKRTNVEILNAAGMSSFRTLQSTVLLQTYQHTSLSAVKEVNLLLT